MEQWKKILGDAFTEEIGKALNDYVGKGYVSKDDYATRNEELKTAKATISERDEQIKTLGTATKGNEELTATIAKLQADNKTAGDKYAQDLKTEREARLLDAALLSHNPVSLKAIKAELDPSKLKYTEDGQIEGLTAQLDGFKKDDNLKALFKVQEPPIRFGAGGSNAQGQGQADTAGSIKPWNKNK